MPSSRVISIVLVDENKGIGTDIYAYPDAQVEYTGDELVIKPLEVYDEFYVVSGHHTADNLEN